MKTLIALVALALTACAASHEVDTTTDSLAIDERPEVVVLFVASVGIWDGSTAGQTYRLLEGCEYTEWTDGEVNVNALAPATEPPTCPETVTIHGEVASGPVLTSASSEDPAVRIYTCTYAAPNVTLNRP